MKTDLNDWKSIAGGIWFYVAAAMIFLLLPLYLGALVDHHGYDSKQIGIISAVDLGGTALAAFLALFWIRKASWKRVGFIASILLCVINFLSIDALGDYSYLLSLRFISGFSAGCLVAIGGALLADTENPDRNFAWLIIVELGVAAILFFYLPGFMQAWGASVVYMWMVLAGVLALASAYVIPSRGKNHAVNSATTGNEQWLPFWGLAGSGAFFIGNNGVSAFMERMGVANDLSAEFIGNAFAIAMLASIGAAFAASWLGDRWGRLKPMIVGLLGQTCCLIFLFGEVRSEVYLAVIVFFQMFWNFWLPYQMAAVAEADISGRFIVLLPVSQAVGIALGPLLASRLLSDENFTPVILIGMAFSATSLILFWPLVKSQASGSKDDATQSL